MQAGERRDPEARRTATEDAAPSPSMPQSHGEQQGAEGAPRVERRRRFDRPRNEVDYAGQQASTSGRVKPRPNLLLEDPVHVFQRKFGSRFGDEDAERSAFFASVSDFVSLHGGPLDSLSQRVLERGCAAKGCLDPSFENTEHDVRRFPVGIPHKDCDDYFHWTCLQHCVSHTFRERLTTEEQAEQLFFDLRENQVWHCPACHSPFNLTDLKAEVLTGMNAALACDNAAKERRLRGARQWFARGGF